MVKAAVLVSGGGTNLQALLDARGKVLHSAEIALVLSNRPDAYALERAKAAGVPAAVCLTEEEMQTALENHAIELVVLAGFLKILSPAFTARWKNRILNIHPALLPAFGGKGMYGRKVHEAALAAGVKITGATVHFVTAEVDGGAIIAQKEVAVLPQDTPEMLQRRVMEQAEWVLLPKAVEQVAAQMTKHKKEQHTQNGEESTDAKLSGPAAK